MSKQEKQQYLKEQIIAKGYDDLKFIDFLEAQRENGADINSWEFEELTLAVSNFQKEEDQKKSLKNSNQYDDEDSSEQNSPIPRQRKLSKADKLRRSKLLESSSSFSNEEEDESEEEEPQMISLKPKKPDSPIKNQEIEAIKIDEKSSDISKAPK